MFKLINKVKLSAQFITYILHIYIDSKPKTSNHKKVLNFFDPWNILHYNVIAASYIIIMK